MKHGFVQTSHGRLHYLEGGKGPALVDVMWAMREFDAAGALRALRRPAAAIVGAKGNVVSNRGPYDESLGKELVAVLPDCGHFPMIDDPALFVKEVNRLLAAAAKK